MVVAWTRLVGSDRHSEEWSDDIEKVELTGISDTLDVVYESQESRMILVRSTSEKTKSKLDATVPKGKYFSP